VTFLAGCLGVLAAAEGSSLGQERADA